MIPICDTSATLILDRLISQRKEELGLALNSKLMLDATEQSIIYRYRQQEYLCGSFRIGRWERIYEMHGPSYPQEGTLRGHMNIPHIIKIDLLDTKTEKNNSAPPPGDTGIFDNPVAEVASGKEAFITISTLVAETDAALTYRKVNICMLVEALMQKLGGKNEGGASCMSFTSEYLFSLFGKGIGGYVKL
ncbi:MAG: hypothetical protein CYPHOPRED_002037 [Cyphobasidiales sp. Tagirdzhanova-0007]|nr:MAG: hypothetical protein CYPHOPRED_002037 [Cyphobasidiales sp. Tagirdzhanova-0007]